MLTASPFDDLRSLLTQLPDADSCAASKFRDSVEAKGFMAEQPLVDLGAWLAAWQANKAPAMDEVHICLLASSYFAAGADISVPDYIQAAARGRAPVNLLCVDRGIGLRVIELAPEVPHDPEKGWSEADCMAAVAFGMEAAAAGGSLLALTDLAPGNEARAMAIVGFLAKAAPGATPLDDVATGFLAQLEASGCDALAALQKVGGREIAAMVGAAIAARSRRLPVIVDGWAGLAAIAILEALRPGAADHILVAGTSGGAQQAACGLIGRVPLVGAPVGVGPGCASALAVPILAAATALPSMPTL